VPIPSYNELLLPILKLSCERPWATKELLERISNDLKLSPEDRAARIPSGLESLIYNRMGWATTYLKQAGLIDRPKRGVIEATESGRVLIARSPTELSIHDLKRYPPFIDFLARTRKASAANGSNDDPPALAVSENTLADEVSSSVSETPEDKIEAAARTMDEVLRQALLARLIESSPAAFERLVIQLLLAMNYGGAVVDAGKHMGRSGDGGVDGMISEDQLGLDRVYLQAKRYATGNKITPGDVQAFVGALVNQGAQKGVFITTSEFTTSAKAVASRTGHLRLVLIDGEELTRLMVRFGVGVRTTRTIELKRVDLTYFDDAELQ
jgi:restriction system protein